MIAEEAGEFTIDDVAADITAKMRRRNPHVFADAAGGTPEEINEAWESIKATEKQRASVTDGIPPTLPALLYADKVLDRLDPQPARRRSTRLGRRPRRPAARPGGRGPRVGRRPEQALRDAVRRLL